jgi:hypothetical protein
LKLGLDVFDHQSWQTGGILYLGPEFNFNILSVKKISLSLYTGALGIIGGTRDGIGGSASLFLNPVLKYDLKYFALGIDLRNYITLGFYNSNYYFNPVLAVILKL